MNTLSDLMTREEVTAACHLPYSTLYYCLKRGTFPRPLHLSPRKPRWRRADVQAWIDARLAEAGGSVAS